MVVCKKQKPATEHIILKPHLYTKREVIITLDNIITNTSTTADRSLHIINKTIIENPIINQPPFVLIQITNNNYLILTTSLTTKAIDYEPYLQIITNAMNKLNPVEVYVNEY
jgi:hypothetical protein